MVRVKRRYFVLQVNFPERLNYQIKYRNSLKQEILKAVENLHGEYGLAAFTNAFQIKYSNVETGIYYIRIDRNAEQLLTTALPLITKIEKEKASLSSLFVSATIRHGHLFLKKYNQGLLSKNSAPKPTLTKKERIKQKRKQRV